MLWLIMLNESNLPIVLDIPPNLIQIWLEDDFTLDAFENPTWNINSLSDIHHLDYKISQVLVIFFNDICEMISQLSSKWTIPRRLLSNIT